MKSSQKAIIIILCTQSPSQTNQTLLHLSPNQPPPISKTQPGKNRMFHCVWILSSFMTLNHNWSDHDRGIESICLNFPASGLDPGPVAPQSLPEAERGQSSNSTWKELPPKPRLQIFKTTSGTRSSQKPPRFVSIKVERMTVLRINKKWCVSRFKWLMPLKNIEYFYQHLVNWYVL